MANPLTGGFDAAVHVSLSQIDGLLATLHQNGADGESPLKLLHSEHTRVGDERLRPPEIDAFADWVVARAGTRPARPAAPLRDMLVATSPPGASQRVDAGLGDLELLPVPPPADDVRGAVAVQISTLRVEVPDGSTSEVTVRADIRARYDADPGTTPVREDIHGTIRATYEVRRETDQGTTRLVIRPSPHDEKIAFLPAPGSGVDAAETARISTQLRKLLRQGVSLPPIELPEGFPFSDFKGVGSGADPALVLPLQLSGNPPPAGGAQGVTQTFLGESGGFGIAVSREFVTPTAPGGGGVVDLEAIREAVEEAAVHGPLGSTYRLSFTEGPTLTFLPGAIEIAGRVRASGEEWWAPSGSFGFEQRVTMALRVGPQQVELALAGDPEVSLSWWLRRVLGTGTAREIVKAQVLHALEQVRPEVQALLDDGRSTLEEALVPLEPSVSVRYAAIEISPDGVLVRGGLSSAPRIPPVVRVREEGTDHFSAFESWIPGGWIDHFTWSWIEYPAHPLGAAIGAPWSGEARVVSVPNRFLLPRPDGITELSRICLRVEGRRVRPDGSQEVVSGGTVCEVGEPVLAVHAPSWWEPVTVPLWSPDPPHDAPLRDAIVGHVGLQPVRADRGLRQNTVVFFPDWESDAPFDGLVRGLEAVRRRPVALAVFLVLPPSALDLTRRELEARLPSLPPFLPARLQVAEDAEGGWSRTFDVRAKPAAFLVNARGEFVWGAAGALEPEALAAAVDRHAVPAPGPRFRPLRLNVSVGERAPDLTWRDDRGQEGSLHRLRGRPVRLVFWQSWSGPGIAELRRLGSPGEAPPRGAPLVLAFHGGPDPGDFEELRRRHRISHPIVPDTGHRVARALGVRCWPTTVAVGPDGLVEQIRFGGEPGPERESEARPPSPRASEHRPDSPGESGYRPGPPGKSEPRPGPPGESEPRPPDPAKA
jgi:peroxiredoxin